MDSHPIASQQPPSAEQSRWFADEVHPHDGHLKAYLRGSFPSVRDVEDVVQESYLRICRANASRNIRSAKAYLFQIARNVAIDFLRHSGNSPIDAVGDVASLPAVMEDKRGVVDAVSTEEKLRLLADAVAALPPRCRELIVLCKIKGLTHAEAAERFGISLKTVDEHICRGLKRLGEELRKREIDSHYGP